MAATFVHNVLLPDDPSGWGMWLTEHYYEHLRFILIARDLTTPVLLEEYDILSWSDEPAFVQGWLGAHMNMHIALRDLTNVGGVDLQSVDLSDDDQFSLWLESHAQEHRSLEQLFGAV